MRGMTSCFRARRKLPASVDCKGKLTWPPVFTRSTSEPSPLPSHNAFYSDFKFIWIPFKLLGFFPYYLSKKGDVKFKWFSKEMLYSVLIYVAWSVPVASVLSHRCTQWREFSGDFHSGLHIYMMMLLMIPHLLIPATHWLELSRFQNIFKTWRIFQVSYEELLNVGLRLPFRYSAFKVPIFVVLMTCSFVLGSYFATESQNVRDIVAHFYVYSIFVLHAWLIVVISCRLTNLSRDLRARLAMAITAEDLSFVTQFMTVWTNLSKSAQNVANLFYRMYGHLFCVVFAITTITIYGILRMLARKVFHRSMLYLLAGLINNNMWVFLVCETAERLTLEVGHKYIVMIGRLRASTRNPELKHELDSFLALITANPPKVSLCNYITINRRLLVTIHSTMVTYLIVVLQFSQDYSPMNDLPNDNDTNLLIFR